MADVRVDPLLSYARRAGDNVRVVLVVDPGDVPHATDLALQLRDDEVLDAPATVTRADEGRARIEALVPGARLEGGTWRMKLVNPASGERRNLQTRVLVRAGMPVALLPGRPPETRMPEPAPR
ncbi:MAG: hypothetical protein ABWZ91_13720 [Nocardioides sp.]|jgi:hypothetical protein